jgi:hypothetical protein
MICVYMSIGVIAVSLFAYFDSTAVAADTTLLLENHLKAINLELTLSNIENTDMAPFMVNVPKSPKGPGGPPT